MAYKIKYYEDVQHHRTKTQHWPDYLRHSPWELWTLRTTRLNPTCKER